MRRFYYYIDVPETRHTPIHEIAYAVGRIVGYVLLFGLGFVGGQVIRGIFLALL